MNEDAELARLAQELEKLEVEGDAETADSELDLADLDNPEVAEEGALESPVVISGQKAPGWSWCFAVPCGLIPIASLGGAIPIVLGLAGILGCRTISNRRDWPLYARLLLCCGVVIADWILFIAALIGIALIQRTP